MNQIQAKIYYDINTRQVLLITSEMQGDVVKTTKEQDMETYSQLKNKNIEEIDFIELEYGAFASTFNNMKSYSIDIKNKKLNCVYYTQDELNQINKKLNK